MAHLQYFKDVLALPRQHVPRCRHERPHRADGRPLRPCRDQRRDAPHLFRGERRRHSAGVPAHRGLGRTAVAASARRRGVCQKIPHHRVRHALARQIQSAGELERRGISAHHRALHRDRPRLLQGAEAGEARGDGLLDRRPHRAQPRDRPCRRIPRADRAGSRRLSGAVVRYVLAAPSRRSRRRSLRRAGVRPDRAAKPRSLARAKRCGPTCRAGPGVFKGDLYFYRVDGDLRGRVETIDTKDMSAVSADRRV